MNSFYIFILIVIVIIVFQNKKKLLIRTIIKNKKLKRLEVLKMNQIIKNFIGKKCIVYTFDSQIVGTIKQVEDNWVMVLKKQETIDAINIDYIKLIREYPKNKKGKDKAIVMLDG